MPGIQLKSFLGEYRNWESVSKTRGAVDERVISDFKFNDAPVLVACVKVHYSMDHFF